MHIEDLKTWHWVLAGLLAGVLFSCVRMWQGPAFQNSEADTIFVGEFEHLVYAGTKFGGGGPGAGYINLYHKGLAMLKDVVVHPPLKNDPAGQYWVTGREYRIGTQLVDPTKPGSKQQLMWSWKSFKFEAPTPYVPGYAQREAQLTESLKSRQARLPHDGGLRLRGEILQMTGEKQRLEEYNKAFGNQASFPTVLDFLKSVKVVQGSTLEYSFAWYELPAAIWTLPPLAGLLIIGVAWPLALSMMQTWGMARPPAVVKKPKRPAATPPRPAAVVPSSAGVVFKPAVTAPAPKDDPEHAEYRGEFYPVVKSSHKD